MASQDARLCKFEADFKQQQGEMTNKIDTVLKAITDRITGALPSDTCSTRIHSSINSITICPKQPNKPHDDNLEGKEREERSNPENSTPPHPHHLMYRFHSSRKRKYDDSHKEGPKDEGNVTIKGLEVGYFDTFPTRSKLAYHKNLRLSHVVLGKPFVEISDMTHGHVVNRNGIHMDSSKIEAVKNWKDPKTPS
ncbi:hypothetical protein Tco_0016331 [Tanacetum coccineum]